MEVALYECERAGCSFSTGDPVAELYQADGDVMVCASCLTVEDVLWELEELMLPATSTVVAEAAAIWAVRHGLGAALMDRLKGRL